MKSDDKMANKLGIRYESEDKDIPFKVEQTKEVIARFPAKQVEDEIEDYHKARNTLHNVLNSGTAALDQILEVAKGSEHPRAYEVVATLMKTMADTSKDLYDIQEKSRKIRDMDDPDRRKHDTGGQNISVDKGIFVGTSADLLKAISKDESDNE